VQVFASLQSGSLSIITSALDSFLDLVSGVILFLTARSMRKDNKYKYVCFPAPPGFCPVGLATLCWSRVLAGRGSARRVSCALLHCGEEAGERERET
jgi:hypothetical protein